VATRHGASGRPMREARGQGEPPAGAEREHRGGAPSVR
jgi:hypothetical protein